MQEPLWIELANDAPGIFWSTHEKLLEYLAKVAVERESQDGSKTEKSWDCA